MPSLYLDHNHFSRAFADITQRLLECESLWRTRPFLQDELPWQSQYPQLYEALLALDDNDLNELEDETILHQLVSEHLPEHLHLSRWAIAPFDGEIKAMAKFCDVGIPGRKVAQICGFSSLVSAKVGALEHPIVDWCSGKGHLAKQLHYVTGQAVRCLEYNGDLCRQGAAKVAQLSYPVTFFEQDVLEGAPDVALENARLHTAMHACGDLHLSMMDKAVTTEAEHIALSPCCYHLTANPQYLGLSRQAKDCHLSLDPIDLRLAVSQIVTAGNRVRRLRRQELQWRIGFDLLHRQQTGKNEYRQTPSIQKQWLSNSFEDFCGLMADKIGFSVKCSINADELLTKAEAKLFRIERLEKARLAFRQSMEHFLVLDRVLYLQDEGYKVSINEFCPAQVTPRNIAIIASKK